MPYSSKLTPAIVANFLAVSLSFSVQVGERNNTVSEMIADSIKPAIFLGISCPYCQYKLARIVHVHPTVS